MNVSIFHDMTCKLPLPGLLEGVANLIRTDEKLAVFTRSYRQTGSKTFKNESQLFAVPCLFEGGKGRSNIRQLTGMSLVDFDHAIGSEERRVKSEESISDGEWKAFVAKELNILKRKAIADPHTLLCYITMSGNGLRVIFTYEIAPEFSGVPKDEEEVKKFEAYYQQAFYAGNAYYEKLLGAKADMQCKNITRLSGLAHDPEVFLRPQSEVIPFTAEEISTAATAYVKQSKEDKQMQRIQTYFDTLIAPQLAKAKIEFRSGSHNDYVMRVGYKLAERRFSKKVALRWAMQKFGKDYSDTEQVINSCFANASPHGKQGGGGDNRGDSKTATVEEIKSFLYGHISLRFNEITSRVEYKIPADNTDAHRFMPVNDRIVNSLWSQMSTITRVNIQDMYRVIESDYVPVFNPFKAYLNNLCKSVGVQDKKQSVGDRDYIQELAQTVRVKGGEQEQKLWHLYLKKWLVGMVASWISEDVVNNVILVLIGEQGAYKTTWFNYLLPPPLKQYFYTKTNANRMSKDDILTLAQYALVCCEELDTMRPAELNQLKAAVTMPSIDERAAYAHYHEHRKHIASFCGTGNNTQFLSDPTGNRRWLPFEVESILSPREHPFHYEGIYAQALSLYTSGFQYWFTKEEIQELNRHNKQFETPHLEHELVDLYFRRPIDNELGEFISVARALQMICNGISQKLSAVNVGRAFSDLGFKRVRTNSSRGFIVVCRTPEEIKAYQHRLLMDAEPDSEPDAPF
ncbi:VapE domain-containing protein [Segatella copri]|uniref:VapE domain-containing protein n=1 Tax=Segatella copri TaxID=165179 RepID=UPI001931DBA7|nr:VapE domain-containing protein [Segatella copri]MBM0144051.1 virulence protein E [Segatella copri]